MLACACFIWAVAAMCYYARSCVSRPDSCWQCCRGPRLRPMCSTLGRITLTLAIVAFPATTAAAVRMLNCATVDVPATPAALAALDGSPGLARANATTATAPGLLTITLLSSDPFFVCWAGSHREAGVLAIAAIVFFVTGMPCIVFSWLVAPAVYSRCRAANAATKSASAKLPSAKGCLRCAPTEADPILLPVVSDYQPAAWYAGRAIGRCFAHTPLSVDAGTPSSSTSRSSPFSRRSAHFCPPLLPSAS